MDTMSVVRKNIGWFRDSGIMHPADGYWGVAERIITGLSPDARAQVNRSFPFQTELGGGVTVLEHRRPDCNFETAYALSLASRYLGDQSLSSAAHAIVDFCTKRSGLRCTDDIPQKDLWEFYQPVRKPTFYIDDNSWVITFLLLLGRTVPAYREMGIAAARKLLLLLGPYTEFLRTNGVRLFPDSGKILSGLSTNPHWMGLVTMAFAHAAAVDPQTDYAGFVETYYERYALAGPPKDDRYAGLSRRGLPWSLSEYAYLTLTASICAKHFKSDRIRSVARTAADILIGAQQEAGNFPAEHGESPAGEHLVDLIYTQNWATLGLLHAAILFNDDRYKTAAEKSLELLARIQDTSTSKHFNGCWRGMYDIQKRTWGGGDHYEGGAGSIYSGWTNAPIMLAFLFSVTGETLFSE
ncbi:MAG: hypothetical protein AABZ39_08035 [Spirochaetota bacterium]